MTQMLTERYRDRMLGVLSCYDRIVITGTLPGVCYAAGMTSFLYAQGIRIFDYARFAEPLRDRIRARAQEVCAEAGLQIEHLAKAHIRKEDVVAKVLERRGDHPGLVHRSNALAERLDRLAQHIGEPGRLAEDPGQFLEQRAGPVGLIAHLVSRRAARQQPGRSKRGQLAMQRARRHPCQPHDLAHVEALLGMKQQQTENAAPIGAEQQLDQTRSLPRLGHSHIENKCTHFENALPAPVKRRKRRPVRAVPAS